MKKFVKVAGGHDELLSYKPILIFIKWWVAVPFANHKEKLNNFDGKQPIGI